MDFTVVVITFCIFVFKVSTKQTNGNYTVISKKMISVPGATILFSCPINCTNDLPVWSFKGYVLSDGFRINPDVPQKKRLIVKKNCDEQTNNLLISNISKYDEGIYCCEDKLIHHCTVLELTELIIQGIENSTLHGVEGENVSLTCFLTKATLGVQLKVVRNQSTVAAGSHDRLNVSFEATKDLNGERLSCVAKLNDLDIPLEKQVLLNISYTPEVKIKILPDSNLIVRSNAYFICSYDSNPSPTSILWQKNGSDLSTNKTFVINNISLADAGLYRCIVNNGNVSEDNIEISVLDGKVVQLQNGSLICNTTGFTTNYTFSYWEHQTTSGKHIRFLTQKSNETIDFNKIEDIPTYKINGRYVCKVENVSIAYKNVFLSGKPICLENDKEVFGQVDKNVIIAVKVYSSNFFTFNWWKGDLRLTNTSKYTFFKDETSTKVKMYSQYVELETTTIGLQIKELTEKDFNIVYAVTIYSGNGNNTCELILRTRDTFHHYGILFYVVATFFCTVVILIANAIWAKTRKGS